MIRSICCRSVHHGILQMSNVDAPDKQFWRYLMQFMNSGPGPIDTSCLLSPWIALSFISTILKSYIRTLYTYRRPTILHKRHHPIAIYPDDGPFLCASCCTVLHDTYLRWPLRVHSYTSTPPKASPGPLPFTCEKVYIFVLWHTYVAGAGAEYSSCTQTYATIIENAQFPLSDYHPAKPWGFENASKMANERAFLPLLLPLLSLWRVSLRLLIRLIVDEGLLQRDITVM